jgi:hypothetical protein
MRIFFCGEGVRASLGSLFFIRHILDVTGITLRETGEPGKGALFGITVPKGAYRLTDVKVNPSPNKNDEHNYFGD